MFHFSSMIRGEDAGGCSTPCMVSVVFFKKTCPPQCICICVMGLFLKSGRKKKISWPTKAEKWTGVRLNRDFA